MKLARIAKFVFLLTICAINRPTIAQPSYTANAISISELNNFRAAYTKSMLNKNTDLIQTYFGDNIRMMPPFQKTLVGKTNAVLYQKAFTTRFIVHEFTRKNLEILDLGSQVMEVGTFSMRLTLKSTGKEHNLVGKYLDLWQEMSDGKLSQITDAWNYDQYYGELHEQLRFEEMPSIHAALLPNVPINNSISFELAALNRLLDATVTQHDGNTWSLYYSDDAMLLASYDAACVGKMAIDNYIKAHVKDLPVFEELDIRNDHIDNLGVFVVEYASHIASWKNGGSSGVSMGKNIRVWRREPDHSLKLFRSISMYD